MAIEQHSETWQTIERKCAEMRQAAMNDLLRESANVDRLRGMVFAIDTILGMGDPSPPPTITTSVYE